MLLKVLYMVGIFAIIAAVYTSKLKKAGKSQEKIKDQFIEEELEALAAPKKPIPTELFITPDAQKFPFRDYTTEDENGLYKKVCVKQKLAARKIGLKMLTFNEQLSNTELKLTFGARNLDTLMLYEEHYNGFMRSLYDWAYELFNIKMYDDAIQVLSGAIHLNADMGKIFYLLAEIYYELGEYDKIEDVILLLRDSRCLLKDSTEELIRFLAKPNDSGEKT